MVLFSRRLTETFLFELITSGLVKLVFHLGVLTEGTVLQIIAMTALLILNAAFLAYCLKESVLEISPKVFMDIGFSKDELPRGYFSKKEKLRVYYGANLTVWFLMALFSTAAAFFPIEPLYGFLFEPFELFYVLGIFKPISALIVNIIMLVIIFAVQFFMKEHFE